MELANFPTPDIMYLKIIGYGKRLWRIRNKESYSQLRDLESGDTLGIMKIGWLSVCYQQTQYDRKEDAIIGTIVCEPMRLEFDYI